MKKISFLAPLAILASLILPSTVAFAAIDASSLGFGDAISNSMNAIGNNLSLTCTVEATTKLVGLTQNEVTYKLKYSSSYSELNATYNVQAASPDTFLHQKGGAFSLVKGNNYVPLTANNGIENKFTYDIKDNPSVTIQANIKGVKCVSKTLQTAKPASAQINPSVAGNTGVNTNLSGSAVKSTTTVLNIPPSEIVIPQNHTCQVLAEGAILDSNSLKIGAGVKFDNLAKGKFNYSIRGFLSTSPNLVKEYTGVYSNGVASASGIILDADKKGFLFTFDAKKPTDKYVVAATIGNIDCKLVYFASPIKAEEQVAPDANNSDQNAPNNNGSISGEGTVAPEAGVDAQTQDETTQLNLLDDNAGSTKNTNQPATTSTIIQVMQNASTNYVLYGLLGAIFLSIVTYTVLRYRGMI